MCGVAMRLLTGIAALALFPGFAEAVILAQHRKKLRKPVLAGSARGQSLDAASLPREQLGSPTGNSSSSVLLGAAAISATAFHVHDGSLGSVRQWSSQSASAQFKRAKGITPEIACNIADEYEAEPLECPQGADYFNRTELKEMVPFFTNMLQQQALALGPEHCCMGYNHMFSLFSLISKLKPAVIIESGVAAGHQTWMLRLISVPYTPIFSIDPSDPAINYPGGLPGMFKGWKDTSGYTTYFTAGSFADFSAIQWDVVIPDPAVRAKTLVILDDHQSCTERFKVMQKYGFRWAFYEDNYPFAVATSAEPWTCLSLGTTIVRDFPIQKFLFGDAYSPNAACGAPLKANTSGVLYKDKFGTECKVITPGQHDEQVAWLRGNMEKYFEFPALFSPCPRSKREPLFGGKAGDASALVANGLPPQAMDIWHYAHLNPPFIELKAASPPLPTVPPQQPAPAPATGPAEVNATTTPSPPVSHKNESDGIGPTKILPSV